MSFPMDENDSLDHQLSSLLGSEENSRRTLDRPAQIFDAIPTPPLALRIALGTLGAVQLVITLPWLIDADPFGLLGSGTSSAHTSRDGAFGLVVAAAALLTAWRPRWALPAFLIGAVAVVSQAIAGLLDDSIIEVGANEVVHFLSILLTVLTGLAAVRLRPLGPTRWLRPKAVKDP